MDAVTRIMRETASEAILPRFRDLRAGDVEEKSPGEVVTIADRAAERLITPQLLSLLPGSRVVGEEAATLDPSLLQHLDEGHVWLVDPLDGTGNFVAGDPRFATMIALMRDGDTLAGWMLEPVSGRLSVAERGGGAYIDGQKARSRNEALDLAAQRGIVRTRFLPPVVRQQVASSASCFAGVLPGSGSTAFDYPAIATGAIQFALYWRTLPWDHAAPALFLREAGGHVARLDGGPYRPADDGVGLLAASSGRTWEQVNHALLAGGKAVTAANGR